MAAALFTAYGTWTLTAPQSLAQARNRLYTALGGLWATRAGAPVRRRAQTLGWPPHQIPATAAVIVVVLTAGLATLSPAAALFGLIPALILAWLLALQTLNRAFTGWQKAMLRGLPGLITVLRIHLDLGLTVPDAMREALHGASPLLRRELALALADMQTTDHAKEGLTRLAERTESREWRVFADTLSQAWDIALTGTALAPLVELIQVVQDREARETTGRLHRVISTAPGMALFAIALWAAGGFLAFALSKGGGGL